MQARHKIYITGIIYAQGIIEQVGVVVDRK
jgi:hypothetical protein